MYISYIYIYTYIPTDKIKQLDILLAPAREAVC
jgi:hypothetical protein